MTVNICNVRRGIWGLHKVYLQQDRSIESLHCAIWSCTESTQCNTDLQRINLEKFWVYTESTQCNLGSTQRNTDLRIRVGKVKKLSNLLLIKVVDFFATVDKKICKKKHFFHALGFLSLKMPSWLVIF